MKQEKSVETSISNNKNENSDAKKETANEKDYKCKGDLSSYVKKNKVPTITHKYLNENKINIVKIDILSQSNQNKHVDNNAAAPVMNTGEVNSSAKLDGNSKRRFFFFPDETPIKTNLEPNENSKPKKFTLQSPQISTSPNEACQKNEGHPPSINDEVITPLKPCQTKKDEFKSDDEKKKEESLNISYFLSTNDCSSEPSTIHQSLSAMSGLQELTCSTSKCYSKPKQRELSGVGKVYWFKPFIKLYLLTMFLFLLNYISKENRDTDFMFNRQTATSCQIPDIKNHIGQFEIYETLHWTSIP